MQWFAQAPANIALIKYMGKRDAEHNIPANPSLSYTLHKLVTNVSLEACSGKYDDWEPLNIPGSMLFKLPLPAQQRFLDHLAYIKSTFDYTGSFIVRSSNNFPTASGLASSASSFAALTKCATLALSDLTQTPCPSVKEQALLSQKGSGSSCRSFYAPWAYWDENTVKSIELPYNELIHQVIVVSHEEKLIPSSIAHQRVQTSSLYESRQQQATEHLQLLLEHLKAGDWNKAYQVCWKEFQSMHELFTTSSPPFTYMTKEGNDALKLIQTLWEHEGDGPIVTMDAGPNIHLLYRTDQAILAEKFKQDYLVGNYDLL